VTDSPTEKDEGLSGEFVEVGDQAWKHRVVARSLGVATRQSLDRAHALMKATVELLEVSGENVTVQDVADRAGYSLRILYRHFSSKDDLLAAVLEDQLEAASKRIRPILERFDDPVERLGAFIRQTIHLEATPRNLAVAMARQEARLLLSHPAEVARAQAPMAALAGDLVKAAVVARRIESSVAGSGVYGMMALKRAYNYARLLGDESFLPLPTEEEMVAQCLRGFGVDERQILRNS
jgi:AcrR family transcriptional regulator